MIFLCSHSIYVMFDDIFSDVHVIYMRCSIMYQVMFYDVFSSVHLNGLNGRLNGH